MILSGKLAPTRLIGATVAGAIAIAAGTAFAKDEVQMAIPTFLTGAGAPAFGIPAKQGSELIIEAINAGTLPAPYNSKGLAGAKIKPLIYDESGGGTKQVTELRNKVQKQNVDMVVGYISSGTCAAVSKTAEELQVFTILTVCGTPRVFEELVPNSKYVFRTMNHATANNVSAARYVAQKFGKKKGYTGLNQNYAWGQDSWRDFNLAMAQLAPQVKPSGKPKFPKLFSGQYGAEISALLRSKADIIHSSFWGGDLEALFVQGTGRGLFKRKLFVFTVGDTVVYGLGKKFPNGIMVGARGPYGIYAVDIDTPLNTWFQKAYRAKYKTPPTQPAYQYAQGILAAKFAYDAAAKANGGKFPTTDQVIAKLTGATFQSLTTKVKMSLGKGHQGVTDDMWGVTVFDEKRGEHVVKDVIRFSADCVNPPEGVHSVEWIKGGMKGAKCS